ncbi:right-handed parallel beta-helix repeat-containing protein [Cohnella hashimotonis]|uniref:Right-handed parallel beta-helix repeat-containing protein n=1 Tax=Cohnella hashimotonis TaxID=2826895 RepID=A0ABT6THZ1_9BACL|nr:right-handed parallel beta-helix repeat-containing protein [Cohnella hashimotonis]MDI4646432.1 right-handed parallel beta-helix repeat-containing protein [Cohnella hashimotonis]
MESRKGKQGWGLAGEARGRGTEPKNGREAIASQSSSRALFRLEDFEARPDSGKDATVAMRGAIAAASAAGRPALLVCKPERYDFYPAEATRAPYFITNTASAAENPDITKTIGIFLKNAQDLIIDGGGALFVFHGKQTMLALDGCERVEIRNLRMDYASPTVTEAKVTGVGADWMTLEAHPDSRYIIDDGKLFWAGDGWTFHEGPMQAFDPVRDATWRIDNVIEAASAAEEEEPGLVRLRFGGPGAATLIGIEPGFVLQCRDGVRDQVGVFLLNSRDVKMEEVGLHFMHGLGIVGQYSERLTFSRLTLAPRPETGRTVAAFADFVHLMGCKGKISIADSLFSGAHDDAINVHGTYMRIEGRSAANRLRLRFMHPQSYGFAAFRSGDEIEFAGSGTLTSLGTGTVAGVERLGDRLLELTLAEPAPEAVGEGDVVENVTWTPEVLIAGNRFARIPTRGILLTTRRPAVVENNTFERTRMSAVWIEGDASSWFESGPVRDLTIRGNRFVDCGDAGCPVVAIIPAIPEPLAERPVHQGIRILDNRFETRDAAVLEAHGTRGLAFVGNEVRAAQGAGFDKLDDAIRLAACVDADIRDNRLILAEDGL